MNEKKPAEPLPVDPEERWDWEFYEPPPPLLHHRTVLGKIVRKGSAKPLPMSADEDVLDWDAYSPPPPSKRQGTIKVRLKYMGRSKPLPADDPHAD